MAARDETTHDPRDLRRSEETHQASATVAALCRALAASAASSPASVDTKHPRYRQNREVIDIFPPTGESEGNACLVEAACEAPRFMNASEYADLDSMDVPHHGGAHCHMDESMPRRIHLLTSQIRRPPAIDAAWRNIVEADTLQILEARSRNSWSDDLTLLPTRRHAEGVETMTQIA